MDSHVFLQKVDGARVVEHAMRAEATRPNTGFVLEAPYLVVGREPIHAVLAAPVDWVARLRRWLGMSVPVPEAAAPARGTQLRIRTPFDATGNDVLGLLTAPPPFVQQGDTAKAGIRRAVGRAVALQGGEPLLFDDLWVEADGWRIAQGHDFAVVTQDQIAVVVSCGLAPLIVAVPRRLSVAEHLPGWNPKLHTLLQTPDSDAWAWSVSIREGDQIEVLGVARPLRDSQRAFLIDQGEGSYRRIPTRPTMVLGDEDGTRLVIRVIPGQET